MVARKSTKTLTINAAFLQEIKEVNEELWKLLEEVRQVCCEPEHVRAHRTRVVTLLGQLRDHLAMHFALEEAYGYFEDPVVVAPHLSCAACILRDEHALLYSSICELLDNVEKKYYAGHLCAAACEVVQQFGDFYDQLQRHEAKENELILQAYDDDIGVGD